MATFDPVVVPAPGTGGATELATVETAFGDGYTQRGSRGINAERELVSLVWPVLTLAQRDSIVAFFRTQAGHTVFDYAVPPSTVVKKWTCKTWASDATAPLIVSLTAEFRQEFDV